MLSALIVVAGCGLTPGKSIVGEAGRSGTCDFEWFYDVKGVVKEKVYVSGSSNKDWTSCKPGEESESCKKEKKDNCDGNWCLTKTVDSTKKLYVSGGSSSWSVVGPYNGCAMTEKIGVDYGQKPWCPKPRGKNIKQVYVKGTDKFKYCLNGVLPRGCEPTWYFYDAETQSMKGPYNGCENPDGDTTMWCPEQGSTVSKIIFVEGEGGSKTFC